MNNIILVKISEVLGLSISTVSRALRDHPDISTGTMRKVWTWRAPSNKNPTSSP